MEPTAPRTVGVEQAIPMTPARIRGVLLVLAAACVWGTAGLWTTWILRGSDLSAVQLAFARDLLTFLILFVTLACTRPGLLRVQRAHLPWLALMGGVGIGFFHTLWNFSILLNGVSLATIFQYTAPLVVTASAWALWREPLTGRKLAAMALALTGVALIALPGRLPAMQVTLPGLAVGLGSALAISVYILLAKRFAGVYSPWTLLLYMFGFAALALAPFAAAASGSWRLTPAVAAAFAAFLFLPTLAGFGLYTAGLRLLPASTASILSTIEVAFAALFAYLLLAERLGPAQWLGAGLTLAAVALATPPARPRAGGSR